MTRDEVMAMTDIDLNQRSMELLGDQASAMLLFFAEHGWDPASDIAAAWELHRKAGDELFSRRRRYLCELEECLQVQENGDLRTIVRVAWPDALMFLSPRAITRAFILAMES